MTGRALFAIILIALSSASADAYINGGDYHNTLDDFKAQLKQAGWMATFATAFDPRTIAEPAAKDRAEYVNALVGRAIRAVPELQSQAITDDVKRELIRQAREAIDAGLDGKKGVQRSGKIDGVEFNVGVQEFSSYYTTNERGRQRKHAHGQGLAPFVALRIKGK
jgi:hypothetical protein